MNKCTVCGFFIVNSICGCNVDMTAPRISNTSPAKESKQRPDLETMLKHCDGVYDKPLYDVLLYASQVEKERDTLKVELKDMRDALDKAEMFVIAVKTTDQKKYKVILETHEFNELAEAVGRQDE